ncbi:hypothetical protein F5Y15DRAFT_377790 [Xylariaceae sp. FL0016]|nr:hypothetical protein F5Y15DRAFT_377790 [Xylariaceae sp. FL0016]
MEAIFPSADWSAVDPILSISDKFPPTFIVHGGADTMVPTRLSRALTRNSISMKFNVGWWRCLVRSILLQQRWKLARRLGKCRRRDLISLRDY